MKRFVALLGVLVVGAVNAACKQESASEARVAVAGPITGQYATFGEQMKSGADMAIEDLNAAGGVLGKKLNLTVSDDACDPKQAVAVANKMASDGVIFVAGHFCSGSSIPASAGVCGRRRGADHSGLHQPEILTDERPNKDGG